MIATPDIISLEHVYKRYDNADEGVFAVVDASLAVQPGSFTVILGQSGSGKSTLLKMAGCLIRPSKGYVTFQGRPVDHLNDSDMAKVRREHFGFIFSDIGLLDHLRCFENIQFPELDFSSDVKDVAQQLGLEAYLNQFPTRISQGERQRVLMARALFRKPKVIIADEPTANLDWSNAQRSIALLKSYANEGNTVLLATHDERVVDYATQTIRLEKGKIIDSI